MTNYENDIQAITKNGAEGELTKVSINNGEIENVNTTTLLSEANELNPLAEPVATGQKNIISVDEASSVSSGNNIYINQDNKLMQIDYDTLATAILNKLSTQSFNSLNTSSKLVLDAINELNGKSYLLSGGISIPSESDLNSDTYKIPGNYYCHKSSNAKTLINCPFESAFLLKVSYGTGIDYPVQSFVEFRTRKIAERYYDIDLEKWSDLVYFSDDATLISSNRIWRTVSVCSNGDFKDCNDIPVNCVGNAFTSALNRPNGGTTPLFAIICIGSEVDEYKAQYAFPSQTYINKIQYRFYNYINREWSEWTSI